MPNDWRDGLRPVRVWSRDRAVSEKAATCRRSFTIGEVARLLIDAPGGFAVLEAGDKPAGIITLHDLLRAQETLAVRSTH